MAKQSRHIMEQLALNSRFQHGDDVSVIFIEGLEAFFGEIIGVHFYPGKIKYDIELPFTLHGKTRVYNVDSIFVADRRKAYQIPTVPPPTIPLTHTY